MQPTPPISLRRRDHAVLALLVLAMPVVLGVPAANATPIPDSYTDVSVQASGSSAEGWSTKVQLPEPQHATAGAGQTFHNTDGTVSSFSATGSATAAWDSVSASATTDTQGRGMEAWSGGAGEYKGYFHIALLQAAPFVPTGIPIDFFAEGAGSISGSGTWLNAAWTGHGSVFVYAILTDAFGTMLVYQSISQEVSGPFNARFDTPSAPVFLPPGGPYYGVYLSATAAAFGSSILQTDSTTTSVTASADPVITFDQAAFDAQYGAGAFNLADYYAIVFTSDFSSQSIPEPDPRLTLSIGIFVLAGMRLRARRLRRLQ